MHVQEHSPIEPHKYWESLPSQVSELQWLTHKGPWLGRECGVGLSKSLQSSQPTYCYLQLFVAGKQKKCSEQGRRLSGRRVNGHELSNPVSLSPSLFRAASKLDLSWDFV